LGQRARRKKRQTAARQKSEAAPTKPAADPKPAPDPYARSRERDEQARAELKPLRRGERPLAVTIGALLALGFALANLIAYAAGLEVQGDRPSAAGVFLYSGLMLLVAGGMWRAKYWAVLGMHALLAILIIVFSLLAVKSENVFELLIALAVIGAAGTLFWFLVKAMARIQMPVPPSARR
jgi:hypothetical protein